MAPVSAILAPAGTGDEEGPPLEALEAQMLGEVAAREAGSALAPSSRRPAPAPTEDDEDGAHAGGAKAEIPDLDALVARIPGGVRETLDELFRARFVAVKRLSKKHFQTASSRGASKAGAGRGNG